MEPNFISIIIPVYNGEKTIKNCIESISKQDYPRKRYEIVVVNDASCDKTREICEKYADTVVNHDRNLGVSSARLSGIKKARGEIIVHTDSDVVVRRDTLKKIIDYFIKHKDIDALTGLVSKNSPHKNFFSIYKNLYMHYRFQILPKRVTFLHGSIYAMRRKITKFYTTDFNILEDTAFGQKLTSLKRKIAFLKDLEVIHLKKYTLSSFVKNDFIVPFNWAKIFIRYKGWKELVGRKTGFAHSPGEQLVSVILAPVIIMLNITGAFGYFTLYMTIFLFLLWIFLNNRFFKFLTEEKGIFFGILAVFVTFIDNIIMATGILFGFCAFLISGIKRL